MTGTTGTAGANQSDELAGTAGGGRRTVRERARCAAVRILARQATALAIGACAIASATASATAETLADALVGAYRNSGVLEQNRALLRAADEDVAIAVAALRPVIGYIASVDREMSTQGVAVPIVRTVENESTPLTLRLTIEQLLHDGGATRRGVDAAKQTVLATRQSLLGIEQAVLMRAVAAYLGVVRQQENVALREKNVGVLEEDLQSTRQQFEFGNRNVADVALSESRVAAARAALIAARGALATARLEYADAVGRAPDTLDARPPLPEAPASVDAALAVALRTHPDILESRYRAAAADLLLEQAERSARPRLSVSGSSSVRENLADEDYTRSTSVGISVRQNIYSGGQLNARTRKARASRDSARTALRLVSDRIEREIRVAMENLAVANETAATSLERSRAAQVAFETARTESDAGLRSVIELLSLEQELADARVAEISAAADRYQAHYRVLEAQGLLTAESLRLPVRIYDPAAYYELARKSPISVSKRGRDLDRILESLGQN